MKKLSIVVAILCLLLVSEGFAQWAPLGPYSGSAYSFASNGAKIYAGTDQGVFKSTDYGNTWFFQNYGLNQISNYISAMFAKNNIIFAGEYRGAYRSTNEGGSWARSQDGISFYHNWINSYNTIGNNIFLGTTGMYESTNDGANWIQLSVNAEILCFLNKGTKFYAGGSGIYLSIDSGNTWTKKFDHNSVTGLLNFNDTVYAATNDIGIIKSANDFLNYTSVNTGLKQLNITEFISMSNTMIAATPDSGLFRSTNRGASWLPANNGITPLNTITALSKSDAYLFCAVQDIGLFRSFDLGASWTNINTGFNNKQVLSVFKYGSTLMAGVPYQGIYGSTNGGTSWFESNNGLPRDSKATSFTVMGSYFFTGIESGKTGSAYGVYRSSDGGSNWTAKNNNIPAGTGINSLAVNVNDVYAGTTANTVLKSTNSGDSWTQIYANDSAVIKLFTNNNIIFVSTQVGIFASTNNGTSFNIKNAGLNTPTEHAHSFYADGNRLYIGTDYSIYYSTNGGNFWIDVVNNVFSNPPYTVAASSPYVFAGASNNAFYVSADNGSTWFTRSEGLPYNAKITSVLVDNQTVYIGLDNFGVWKRPYSEVIGIHNISTSVPDKFRLEQNYPNPFNPVTKIRFEIPQQGFVSMKVYDIIGRQVATLVNENLSPGTYEVTFDGKELSSGLYFYRLTSNGFSETKRMLMIK